MLDKFKWDVPEKNAGAYATPFIKITYRPNIKGAKSSYSKYSLGFNKSFGTEQKLGIDHLPTAFSFDETGSLLMAINVPDTVPHYQMRFTSGQSWVMTNQRLVVNMFKHLATAKTQTDDQGTYQIFLAYERLEDVDGVMFYKLTMKP